MSISPAQYCARRILRGKVVAFVGAGLSTESGVPDFRSTLGARWTKYNPNEVATVEALQNNYDAFRDFQQLVIQDLEEIQPNYGHKFLAKWEEKGKILSVITQNVDGLHYLAGSKNVYPIHGDVKNIYCCSCKKKSTVEAFMSNQKCECGGLLRPDIVLFGETLNEEYLKKSSQNAKTCKTLIVFGSSLVVTPANYYPELAHKSGAKLIIINREPTPLDNIADLVVHESIGDFLKTVTEEIEKLQNNN